jgi:hypothetical protein
MTSLPTLVVRFVIALLITSEAMFLVSDSAYLINVGSMPLLTIQNPVAVESIKKTNVNSNT